MTADGEAVHAAVADLGVPFRFERSVKLRAGGLETDRFLVSVERRHLGPAPCAPVVSLLHRLGFPERALSWLRRFGGSAIALHLGHEAAAGRLVRKVYLEQAAKRPSAVAHPDREGGSDNPNHPGDGAGSLVHRALKWDAAAGLLVEASYRLAPHALLDAGPLAEGAAAALARELLGRAERAGAVASTVLLDVSEGGTGRRSFDLQFYELALRRGDCADGLSRLERDFGLADGQLGAAVPAEATLGHLAGGRDARGRPFATLYYGARWRR